MKLTGKPRYVEVLFFDEPLELLQRSTEEIDHCLFLRSENEPHIHDVESFGEIVGVDVFIGIA